MTKSVIAKGVYRSVPREVGNTTARSHSIMSESLRQSGATPNDLKKKKKKAEGSGELHQSHTSVPGKIAENA